MGDRAEQGENRNGEQRHAEGDPVKAHCTRNTNRTGKPHSSSSRETLNASLRLEYCARPQKGDAGCDRLDGADRVGLTGLRDVREVEYLEGKQAEEARRRRDQNMRPKACGSVIFALEPDKATQQGGNTQTDQHDQLRRRGFSVAEAR